MNIERLEADPGSGYKIVFGPGEDHLLEHFDVLVEAMRIHAEREAERVGVWRRSGVKGQVFHMFAKAERAFTQAMRGELPSWDNFVDLINYATFGARLVRYPHRDGDITVFPTDEQKLAGDWPWDG